MAYTVDQLHFPAVDDTNASVFARVSAEQAGWQYLNMVALRLETGKTFGITIEQYEYVAIILSGVCDIRTSKGDFLDIGRRFDVFTGMPYAIYMPRETDFEIEALSDDFAMASCWSPTTEDHPIRLITPQDVQLSVAGGRNASHQVNTIIGDGFDCQRLTVREIYTPGGNWSGFPPHKHDQHQQDSTGNVAETASEELIFHKIDRPDGFALNRLYSDDGTIDTAITAHHNDVVVVPKGYHMLTSAPGYTTYTLHVTAGSAQSLAHTVDPRYRWIHQRYTHVDPRLPIVDHGMEPYIPPTDEA